MRQLAWITLFALLLVLSGCRTQESPPGLLNVLDFAPRQAEVGDRIEIIGTGFPEGRKATLTFRGELHRPGREPIRNVEIVARATSTSQTRIGFVLTEEIADQLCGKGDDADHTTFHGDVIAAFAPRTSGAPPVTGAVRDVELDLPGPPMPPAVVAARTEEGKRAAEFFGVVLEDDEARGGIPVKALTPGGRGERAGLEAGDVLEEVDGVRVRTVADLSVAGVGRFAKIAVRRGKLTEPVELSIDVQGFRRAAPKDLAMAGAIVGLAALLLLSFLFPAARFVTFLEQRIARRLRQRQKLAEVRARMRRGLRDEGTSSSGGFVARVVPYLAFVGVSAGGTIAVFGRSLVHPDLDLGIIVVVLLTAQTASTLVWSGWKGKRRWSLWGGIKGALTAVSLRIPALVAIATVVLAVGSARVTDIVGAQGALPWDWFAFRSPVFLAAFVLVIAALIPSRVRSTGPLEAAELEGAGPSSAPSHALAWVELLTMSQLAALLFAGGFRVPFLDVAMSWKGYALGALLLQLKAWGIVAMVLGLRWVLPLLTLERALGIWWRWILPASLLVLVLSLGWVIGSRFPLFRNVEPLFGYVLFAATLLVTIVGIRRIRRELRVAPAAHVNPWL
ncbi:MAG: NADH-quinone oxidoreductase subunit H [Myxococcales bacterium]|nr:NADH-quinone oxidoreductase subunit H [Myxococcales bacterium]MCB9583268.1 NADH-quinone oxidoreductase subunit H [Polyangiaceae bacterium]